MLVLIQRVASAHVTVDERVVGQIGMGLLALVGIEQGDSGRDLQRMRERLLGYRVFADERGRMNRSLTDVNGELLLVSQFTLAADTRSGMRASFTAAADPERARQLFDEFVAICRENHAPGVETGVFGAHMIIGLVNDGPVTFLLRP